MRQANGEEERSGAREGAKRFPNPRCGLRERLQCGAIRSFIAEGSESKRARAEGKKYIYVRIPIGMRQLSYIPVRQPDKEQNTNEI